MIGLESNGQVLYYIVFLDTLYGDYIRLSVVSLIYFSDLSLWFVSLICLSDLFCVIYFYNPSLISVSIIYFISVAFPISHICFYNLFLYLLHAQFLISVSIIYFISVTCLTFHICFHALCSLWYLLCVRSGPWRRLCYGLWLATRSLKHTKLINCCQ